MFDGSKIISRNLKKNGLEKITHDEYVMFRIHRA